MPSRSAAAIVTNEDKNSENEHNQTTLADNELPLLSAAAGAPTSSSQTILPAKLNGLPVQSLLDAGASESFVNENVAKTAKLKICGRLSRVSLASDKLVALLLKLLN